MNIYLNPDNQGFIESVNSEIYIDKTGLISCTNKYLNTEQKYICVSRPRRFGKSMALKMLAAYYGCGCDSGELFSRYEIGRDSSFEKHLNQYHVIYLNMQRFLSRAGAENMVNYLEEEVIDEIRETYGEWISAQERILSVALEKLYKKTERKIIILIDEWDCVMREEKGAEALQKKYLDFLRDLMKDQSYIALAYMTGILPIKKYGSHSALNMFSEFSMIDPAMLERYVGFTEDEVKDLCLKYGMDFEEVSRWYDGYSFYHYKHVYNPKSVVESMLRHRLSNYWTQTETYEALKVYIDMDYDGLRDTVIRLLGGERIQIETRSFQNDMKTFEMKDDVLTLLIHLGYLAYDSETEEVYIPNREIMEEYEVAIKVSKWQEIVETLKASDRLLEYTLSGEEEEVARALDAAHMEASSILTYNDENSLSCAIRLAYFSARKYYRIIRELPTGKGFADIVFLPLKNSDKPALVIELKYNKDVSAAIAQIKEKQYTKVLEGYSGEILLIGISYDRDTKAHSCRIEKCSCQ